MRDGKRTVLDVRVFDLFKHGGPDFCMAFFVFVDALWAQVQPLADAAGALVA